MSTSTSTSTSSPSPQPESPTDLTPAYQNFQLYTALGFLLGAPILIALPPRKIDVYTFTLGGGFLLSANHLFNERERRRRTTTKSPFGGDSSSAGAAGRVDNGGNEANEKKPTRYEMVQAQLRREKEDTQGRGHLLDIGPNNADNVQRQEQQHQQQEQEQEDQGQWPRSAMERSLEKVWMGVEKPGWKQRRLAEEQEKISRGEGYGSMIVDQIWEVWNWRREKGEQLDEKVRQVLKERDERGAERRRAEEFTKIGKDREKGG
jgi:hypothetical protein